MKEILALIEQAASEQQEQKKARAKLVNSILSTLPNYKPKERKKILTELGIRFPVGELSEAFVKQASGAGAPLGSAASFRDNLTRTTRKRQLSGVRHELELNSKSKGYRFVRELGIRHPKVLSKAVPWEELSLVRPSVLKPSSGSSSNGLFLLLPDEIIEVKSGRAVADENHLMKKLEDLLQSGVIKRDRWVLEELIADTQGEVIVPARDVKFYCFYGKVGLVLEVDRQRGGHYCEWLSNGQRADTGRYQSKRFEGDGFTKQQLAMAKKISQQIPAPFMRIDFLRTPSDFAFCEFTPRPGQYNTFNDEFDRYLGQLYLAAEARLFDDLLRGKSFKTFKSIAAVE